MQHTALYREFRPATFDELIGQEHIVRILKNQIRSESTSHAYLFSGTRGTGKTTTARILAKALNCTGEGEKPCCTCDSCRAITEGSFVDVIEMDAASHRGVSEIQEITDAVMYAPAAGRYKVYIIDEVHMLSTEAFNALLKTLEEPPAHVVFILATTEPQKVPATILSRVMKLDFRRVSERMLINNMKDICERRQIPAEDAALSLIASNADGSVRDSLSILEQCICPGEILRRDDVAEILGTSGVEPLLQITDLILDQNPSGALLLLDDILGSGVETSRFMKEWLGHFRNLLIAGYVENPENLLNMSSENAARLTAQSKRISQALLEKAIKELTETISLTKWARYPRVMLEMTIVKLAAPQTGPAPNPIPSKSSTTESRTASASGNAVPNASPAPERTRQQARSQDRVPQRRTVPAPSTPVDDNYGMPDRNMSRGTGLNTGVPDYGIPGGTAPNAGMPDYRMPGGAVPNTGMPDYGIPGGTGPNAGMMDYGMPGGAVPNTGMPDYGIPGGTAPNAGVPDYGIPGGTAPNAGMPDYEIPYEAMADAGIPDYIMPEEEYFGEPIPDQPMQRMAQEQSVPASAEKPMEPASSGTQMSADIWTWVTREASRKSGLLVRLESRTSYLQSKDDQVMISCDDETTRNLLAGRAKKTVEQLLEQAAGRLLHVVPVMRNTADESGAQNKAQNKERLDQFFGIDVEVR